MKLIKKLFKTLDNLISNKIIKWIIIPCILLLLWFSLSLTYSSYKSFTVLQYPQNQDKNNTFFEKKLLKGQKLIGKFEAKENNLGIVAVKFGNVPRVEFEKEDTIVFRIKEEDQIARFYENKYRSGQVKPNEYFPFGFKPVANSKGKTYEFEIVSLSGNKFNLIETKNVNPIYKTKYKFSKNEIFRNRQSVTEFAVKKILTFFTDYDTLLSSSVFLLPFVFYLIWMIIVGKMVMHNSVSFNLKGGKKIAIRVLNRELFAFLVLTLIFSDIIFFEDLITGFMLGLLGFWVIAIYVNSFKSQVTFILTFIIISLSVFSIYFNWIISIDKASTFAFMFIVIGLLQNLLEHKSTYVIN